MKEEENGRNKWNPKLYSEWICFYDVETFLKPIKEVRIEYTWYKAVADKMDIIINGYVLHFYLKSLEW